MSMQRALRGTAPSALLACAVLALAACGGSDESDDGAAAPTTTVVDGEELVREGSDESREGVTVTREEAEQIALDAVGEGHVSWSGPEDDRGAAWEVEVTRADGSEVDVLVAADGTVVKQVEKQAGEVERDYSATASPSSVISREEAEQIALDAVGEGRVTWAGREDERGAAWEIEVTRPDGSEIDVLVAADGRVVS